MHAQMASRGTERNSNITRRALARINRAKDGIINNVRITHGEKPRIRQVLRDTEIQQLPRNLSKTRAPKRRPLNGTRSSVPWNVPEKSSSGGSCSGLNPKHLIPILLNHFASVPAERQYGTILACGSSATRDAAIAS